MSDIDPFDTAKEQRDYLAELVGDGKKFATIEDLAKGKWHSDGHIAQIEAELATLKTQNANGMNVEKLMEEIRKLNEGKTAGSDGQPIDKPATNPPPQDIEKAILETLSKTKKQELTEANRLSTVAKMNEVWGADTPKKLKEAADTIGVSVDFLKEQAQENPNAFYRLVGLDVKQSPPSGTSVPSGTVKVGSPSGTARNWAYYQELKRTNRNLYNDSNTQREIQREAIKQGEAFFN